MTIAVRAPNAWQDEIWACGTRERWLLLVVVPSVKVFFFPNINWDLLNMPSVDGEENGEEEVERSPNEDENMSEDDDEDSSLSSDESSSESSSQCPLIFPRFLCCDFSVVVIAI